MKTKTSISLSEDLVREIDDSLDAGTSRSAFIERVLRSFLKQRRLDAADARDLKSLNRHADALNAEVADVLEYQAPWPNETRGSLPRP